MPECQSARRAAESLLLPARGHPGRLQRATVETAPIPAPLADSGSKRTRRPRAARWILTAGPAPFVGRAGCGLHEHGFAGPFGGEDFEFTAESRPIRNSPGTQPRDRKSVV